MKTRRYLHELFGTDEYGLPDLPVKVSGIKITRAIQVADAGVCTFCFPHGPETKNSKWHNQLRSWKKYRKTQYKL